MKPSTMWSEISSHDLPYPSRSRCSNSYQAPYWKTFTAPADTLQIKSSSPSVAPRIIRSDSVASVSRVRCSVSPLQSLPFPTRVQANNLPSFLHTHELISVSDNKVKNSQLLGLKSLYRNPHQINSLPKCPLPSSPAPTSQLSLSTTDASTSFYASPSTPYMGIRQLLPPSKTAIPDQYTMDDHLRRLRFVRSPVNTPLYDMQLRHEVHSPSSQMKRQMSSLRVQGLNRTVHRNSKVKRRL